MPVILWGEHYFDIKNHSISSLNILVLFIFLVFQINKSSSFFVIRKREEGLALSPDSEPFVKSVPIFVMFLWCDENRRSLVDFFSYHSSRILMVFFEL